MPPKKKAVPVFDFKIWKSGDEFEPMKKDDRKFVLGAISGAIDLAGFMENQFVEAKHEEVFTRYFKTMENFDIVKQVLEDISSLRGTLENTLEKKKGNITITFTMGRPETPKGHIAETLIDKKEITLFEAFFGCNPVDIRKFKTAQEDTSTLPPWVSTSAEIELYKSSASIVLHELVHWASEATKEDFKKISEEYDAFVDKERRANAEHVIDINICAIWDAKDTVIQESGKDKWIVENDTFEAIQKWQETAKKGEDLDDCVLSGYGKYVKSLSLMHHGVYASALNADTYNMFTQAFFLEALDKAKDFFEDFELVEEAPDNEDGE